MTIIKRLSTIESDYRKASVACFRMGKAIERNPRNRRLIGEWRKKRTQMLNLLQEKLEYSLRYSHNINRQLKAILA